MIFYLSRDLCLLWMAKKHCLFAVAISYLSGVLFVFQSCCAQSLYPAISGNVSFVSQYMDVNVVVLENDEIFRFTQFASPDFPTAVLRPPCHTCEPTYNQLRVDNQYLIPNLSKIHVVTLSGSLPPPTAVDIRNCDPMQLHSIKSDVVWVQCAFKNGLMEVVELHKKDDESWYRKNSQNIQIFSSNVSKNGLLLVKEKDGENVTFLYYGSGERLERKGLLEFSGLRYTRPSLLCVTIDELFYVNEELILIQCVLRSLQTESGLVIFNTSNPNQHLTLFHHFSTHSARVHVSEGGLVVLLLRDTVVIRNAVDSVGIEQLVALHSELSPQGVFVTLKDITYFVCASIKAIYFINIPQVLAGNDAAYVKVDSDYEICISDGCSPMQYMEPLLFVPLVNGAGESDAIDLYSLDPVEHIRTIAGVTPYRYFFISTMSEVTVKPSHSNDTQVLQSNKKNGSGEVRVVGVVTGPAVFVVLLIIAIISATLYRRHKNRARYFQYHATEVRFENDGDGIVVVPGRFNNPVWQFHDRIHVSEEESTPVLNNRPAAATSGTTKKKNTNQDGSFTTAGPTNVDHNDFDETASFGFETRQEPTDLRQYVDGLVIGTFIPPN